ncbi:MAG: efflux RND transporter periplasmic adaptor subunit [Candidatus Daviesbacteria bacterium]|nr:efflux RND transporter periplasmic adaptor subunit [Candidatus Daviesbacteria bacterium]
MLLKIRRRKWFIIILLIILGAGIYFVKPFGLFKNPNDNKFRTLTVKTGSLQTTISASGMVKTKNSATMTFLSTGRLGSVNFKEGDKVKKGAVIASLNNGQQMATVSVEQADYNYAQSALDLVLDNIHLYQYGMGGFANIGSANETQTQKTARQEAEMTRDAAYQNLQSAQIALSLTTIIAPFDGVISDISNMEVGQNLSATTGASVTLVGTDEYKFIVDVDEIEYRSLTASQSGEIVLDAYPDDKFKGVISFIGVSAQKLSTGGSVVPVELEMEPSEKLMNGLNGEVTFTLTAKDNVITLPKTAVRKNDGTDFVYVLQKNKPVVRSVTLGETLGNQIEISSGLIEGEKVVLGDVHPD